MKEINIPQSGSDNQTVIKIDRSLMIVGANGSGKTRLGSKIEQNNESTKRISAQRYLQLNDVIPKQDFESAEATLRDIYRNRSPVQPQSDYQQVLTSLFAEEARRDSNYVAESRESITKIEPPLSAKEKVIDVWNFVFPYRTLKLEKDRVRALNEIADFSGTDMSDGEKVGLYLISQVILADKNCILIIDEPELHLHKALMVRLWNRLEEIRTDCTFIYITHDLDFAVSKPASKIIWTQSFKNNQWEWTELDSNDVIPENLFLEIVGSRESILFVEGEKGSLDIQIYQAYYKDFTVVPRGSCEKVIESVKGLDGNSHLHNKKVYGLIDKDFRSDAQLNALKDSGIFSLPVTKIENLFLLPDIIEIVCNHLGKTDRKEEVISEIRNIYESDKSQIDFIASKYRIRRVLTNKFDSLKHQGEYEKFKESLFAELDKEIVTLSLPTKDDELENILEVYPHKGLVRRIQTKLELTGDGYRNLVISLLLSDGKKENKVLETLKKYLPRIE